MDVEALSNQLVDNPEDIIKILVHLGFDEEKIAYNARKHLLTAPRPCDDADNLHGFLLYTDKLKWMYTTRSGKGNIYSLVMELKKWTFPEALNGISRWIGYTTSNIRVVLPFGGFFRKLVKDDDYIEDELPEYSENVLPPADSFSYQFVKDGIPAQIQEKWGVRYDHESDNTLIPVLDLMGRLVGCKARNNDPHCDDNYRWWAYLEYNKTQVVFGLYQNYQNIIMKDALVIGESEKFPMQAEAKGLLCCAGIGGHNISMAQSKIIRSLGVKKIILAFDEGVSEEEIQLQCKALAIRTPFYVPEIFYIFDAEHKYLEPGSKKAPSDLCLQKFQAIFKECLYKYEY